MMLNSWYCDCYLTDDDRRKYKQSRGRRMELIVEDSVVDTEIVKEVFGAFSWEEQQRKCFDTSWVDSILFDVKGAKG